MLTLKIVPRWLIASLEANNNPITTVLRTEELLNTLSFSDVAFYEFLNLHDTIEALFSEEMANTFNVSHMPPASVSGLRDELGDERADRFNQELERWFHKRGVDPHTTAKEVMDGMDLGVDYGSSHFVLSLKLIKQSEDALIMMPVAIVPDGHDVTGEIGVSEKDRIEIEKDLIHNLLGILCTVYDFKVVASSELFKQFCRLSAREEQLKR